jgi:hypothetical protein
MTCDGGCSAGIAIAAVLGALLFVSCCWVYWWSKRRQLGKSEALAVIRDRGPALSVKDRPGPQPLGAGFVFKQPTVTSSRAAHSPIHASPARSGAGMGPRATTTELERSGDGTDALPARGVTPAVPLRLETGISHGADSAPSLMVSNGGARYQQTPRHLEAASTATLGPGSSLPFSLYYRYQARRTVRPARERGGVGGAGTTRATPGAEQSASSLEPGAPSNHISHDGGDGTARISPDSDDRVSKQLRIHSSLHTQARGPAAAQPQAAEAAPKASDAPAQRLTCFTPSTKLLLLPAGVGLPTSCADLAETAAVAVTAVSQPPSVGLRLTGQESLVGFGSVLPHPSPLFVSNKAVSLDGAVKMPLPGRAQVAPSDAAAIDAAAAAARVDASFGGSAADQQTLRGGSASSIAGQPLAPPLPDRGQQASSHLPSPHPLSRLPSHEAGLQREPVGGHRVQLRQANAAAGDASSAAVAAGDAPIFLVVTTERRSNVAEAAGTSAAAASPERAAAWAP